MSDLLIVGVALLALGVALSLARRGLRRGVQLQTLGAALLGIAGFVILARHMVLGSTFGSAFTPGSAWTDSAHSFSVRSA